MNKQLAIIIVSFNQSTYTINCIKSILNTDYSNLQIIVIDNSTYSDQIKELGAFIEFVNIVRLILLRFEKNLGYVGGVNAGLQKAKELNAEHLLVLNNDTLIDKNAINLLLNACESYNNKAIVSGKVYHYDEPERLQQVGYKLINKNYLRYKVLGINEIDRGQYDEVMEMDLLDDVFWLFHIDLYKQIGGYSPYFWFNSEQADFALRAKKAGYKLIYTPGARIWHKGSASLGGRENNPKLTYWHIQSTLIFHFLHLSKWRFIFFYFGLLRNTLFSLVKTILSPTIKKNQLQNIKARIKAIYYFNSWIFSRKINIGENPFN